MTSQFAAALEFRDFRLAFNGGPENVILEKVNLELKAGGFYLLAGESGSGKSSLLKLIAGLWEEREPAPNLAGELNVLGHSVLGPYPKRLRGRVQAVLQDEGLLDDLSPRGNVELGLQVAGKSKRLSLAMLSMAGLDDPPARVSELSGGQRKRVAVARALAGDPELLIFDEPTAGLDEASAREMAKLLLDNHSEAGNRTTIIITHDLRSFEGLSNGTIWIDRGKRDISILDSPRAMEFEESSPLKQQPDSTSAGLDLRRFFLELAGFSR
ncbi:MAG: ATP-binding cassette domain-containing protein, partial [Planctomycetota bacterium]